MAKVRGGRSSSGGRNTQEKQRRKGSGKGGGAQTNSGDKYYLDVNGFEDWMLDATGVQASQEEGGRLEALKELVRKKFNPDNLRFETPLKKSKLFSKLSFCKPYTVQTVFEKVFKIKNSVQPKGSAQKLQIPKKIAPPLRAMLREATLTCVPLACMVNEPVSLLRQIYNCRPPAQMAHYQLLASAGKEENGDGGGLPAFTEEDLQKSCEEELELQRLAGLLIKNKSNKKSPQTPGCPSTSVSSSDAGATSDELQAKGGKRKAPPLPKAALPAKKKPRNAKVVFDFPQTKPVSVTLEKCDDPQQPTSVPVPTVADGAPKFRSDLGAEINRHHLNKGRQYIFDNVEPESDKGRRGSRSCDDSQKKLEVAGGSSQSPSAAECSRRGRRRSFDDSQKKLEVAGGSSQSPSAAEATGSESVLAGGSSRLGSRRSLDDSREKLEVVGDSFQSPPETSGAAVSAPSRSSSPLFHPSADDSSSHELLTQAVTINNVERCQLSNLYFNACKAERASRDASELFITACNGINEKNEAMLREVKEALSKATELKLAAETRASEAEKRAFEAEERASALEKQASADKRKASAADKKATSNLKAEKERADKAENSFHSKLVLAKRSFQNELQEAQDVNENLNKEINQLNKEIDLLRATVSVVKESTDRQLGIAGSSSENYDNSGVLMDVVVINPNDGVDADIPRDKQVRHYSYLTSTLPVIFHNLLLFDMQQHRFCLNQKLNMQHFAGALR
jgi:hypothetical protein